MLGALDHPPHLPTPLLSAMLIFRIRKTFLMRLLYFFWNNYRWILSINGYYNVMDRSKNMKFFEICVKVLHHECHEIGKKSIAKYHLPVVWNKCLLTKNIWYYKIIFSLMNPALSIKLAFMSAKYKDPLVPVSTRDKKVPTTFHENQILTLGN